MIDTMIARAKKTYGTLPPAARDAAATAYGLYLRWWRYDGHTEALVDAALDRDNWSEEQWAKYQQERLAKILHRAATQVPYYRNQWNVRREQGDTSSWEELSNWPVLDKNAVRRQPRAFLADDANPSLMIRDSTSGTSGGSITTWRSRQTSIKWFALFEARTRRWYGVSRHVPWAILGGQVVTPVEQTAPPFGVWNAAMRQLYMSSYHLVERNVSAYLEAMVQRGVRHMYGFASSMYWLALMVRDRGLTAPTLDVAVSNAEPLLPHQRNLIGAVFDCPVRNTYGMAEIVAAATECEHGVLHLWPDAGLLEVLADDNDTPVMPGASGRFVCTGLLNPDMPLVRYEVGDRGALGASGFDQCPCGRRLPPVDRVEGRVSDVLVTVDGRRIAWFNWQFYDLPLREGQVVQEAPDLVRVNVVPDIGFNRDSEQSIAERITQRLGGVRVEINRLDSIPRGPNGKFQAVINRARPS
jgi:phenylacetate-CoA ligase